MVEAWHDSFDPVRFLSKVNVENLLERNEARNENEVNQIKNPCLLCKKVNSSGLMLNDGSFICKKCFQKVSYIKYPEKYEALERKYLAQQKAREYALGSFLSNCAFGKISGVLSVIAWFSVVLLFVQFIYIVVPIGLFVLQALAQSEHQKRVSIWEKKYPVPTAPRLRHFHERGAELSKRDLIILKVFNNWPGYPPFWKYLREVVLRRDGNRCQVSGCPSRLELHVHHKSPVSKGGEHIPTNLITLCGFHHALEPDAGHERIWGKIRTRFYTMVRPHDRKNPVSSGFHEVRAHIRRLELVERDELLEIIEFYGLVCSSCGCKDLYTRVSKEYQEITVSCDLCNSTWVGIRNLTEETGPRLAEILKVTLNRGNWKSRWDMLKERSDSIFNSVGKTNSMSTHSRNTKTNRKLLSPKCPVCGSTMRLIKPQEGQRWKSFWGCRNYRLTGCRGTVKLN